jgi:flagellar protein FliS
MANSLKQALNAYGQNNLEIEVEQASPHKLILMLFEGGLKALAMAKLHIQHHEVGPKGAAISKAIAIIEEGLRSSLDKERGGELAANLDSLYDYMSFRLLEANIRNDLDALEEVRTLMTQLRDAWAAIDKPTATPDEAEVPAHGLRQPSSYGRV